MSAAEREPVAPQGLDPGSFRDRGSRVVTGAKGIYRLLGERAAEEWKALSATKFYERFRSAEQVVATQEADLSPSLRSHAGGPWKAALRHEAVPFVSYPYEWSFSMLRRAALLQLELLDAALVEGMTLKDASPFNVQWIGARPVFIDVASFERWRPGEAWTAYRQFCQLYLYPLLLDAYKGVAFQPWLKGSLEGIDPADFSRLMSWRDLMRPGVLVHGVLQARMSACHAGSERNVRRELRDAGFGSELIRANVRRLLRLIQRLTPRRAASAWSDYTSQHGYAASELAQKEQFVRRAVMARPRRLVWDLGCNRGFFSRVAAEAADYVVAVDADQATVDLLFGELERESHGRILPLVGDMADLSPARGWRGRERKSLWDRGRPDLTLALALVHHLVIRANIPLGELVEWLASLEGDVVVEFVTKDDPKVRALLRNKDDQYADYSREQFEAHLARWFRIAAREELGSRTRILYHAELNRR